MATIKEPPAHVEQKKNSSLILWIWAIVLILCGILMAIKFLYS